MENNPKHPTPVAEKPATAYCPICRKCLPLEPGQPVPKCCGKIMQIMG